MAIFVIFCAIILCQFSHYEFAGWPLVLECTWMYLNVLEWKMYWKMYWKTPLFGPVLELYWRKIEKTAICTWMYLNLGILCTWVCLNFKAPMPLNRQPFHLLFEKCSPCGRPFPIISVFQVIIFMFKLLFLLFPILINTIITLRTLSISNTYINH